MIDVRCSASLTEPSRQAGRCQLLAGHDGAHALLFTSAGERTLRTWRGITPAKPMSVSCANAVMSRPWVRGFPTPAWIEPEPTSLV
jgi:hypothetical protein